MFTGKCSCDTCVVMRGQSINQQVYYAACRVCTKLLMYYKEDGEVDAICSTCKLKQEQDNKHDT